MLLSDELMPNSGEKSMSQNADKNTDAFMIQW